MSLIISDGFPRNLGYLETDQRNVHDVLPPGTPRHLEQDTYTCSHCQYVVVRNPERIRERYKCKGCDHHICDACQAKMFLGAACKTHAQIVEEIQERDSRQPELASIILP